MSAKEMFEKLGYIPSIYNNFDNTSLQNKILNLKQNCITKFCFWCCNFAFYIV